jgi:hypothetical protein
LEQLSRAIRKLRAIDSLGVANNNTTSKEERSKIIVLMIGNLQIREILLSILNLSSEELKEVTLLLAPTVRSVQASGLIMDIQLSASHIAHLSASASTS